MHVLFGDADEGGDLVGVGHQRGVGHGGGGGRTPSGAEHLPASSRPVGVSRQFVYEAIVEAEIVHQRKIRKGTRHGHSVAGTPGTRFVYILHYV